MDREACILFMQRSFTVMLQCSNLELGPVQVQLQIRGMHIVRDRYELMSNPAPDSMTEATRLTRMGKLSEATSLIQRLLSGRSAPEPGSAGRKPTVTGALDLKPGFVRHLEAKKLKAGRKPGARGAFSRHTYVGMGGALDYMLFIPSGLKEGAPLVVMLHGCTQTAEDFARGTGMNDLAEEIGVVVVYPEQSAGANMQRCWNWFRPDDQDRDHGEPQLIAGITREAIDMTDADTSRIYVAGLSAGGAAAAIMAETHPDLYAACGIHSGLSHGAADSMMGAFTAMRSGASNGANACGTFTPVITFHGDRDTTVAGINSDQIIAAASARASGSLLTSSSNGTSSGGQRYTREISTDQEGKTCLEQWTLHGAGHAWSGGQASGSYTDPAGPDASREMLRFFLQHRQTAPVQP